MARYIDAELFLKNETKRCGSVPLIGTCTTDNESLAYQLAKAPTADVAEVKHGEWDISGRYKFVDGSLAVRCSECGCSITSSEYERYHWNYCPNCGAKMDGGKI